MNWETDTGRDVTSAFVGITAPLRELYDEIHQRGWTVNKVDVKDNQYVATIKNPYGETIEKTGPNPETAVGHTLMALMRHETIRYQGHFGAWDHSWADQLPDIAKAYAEAPIYDPKAAGAWKELGHDCESRAQAIANQIHVEPTADPHPYEDLSDMAKDVQEKKHIYVTKANAAHPVWSTDQVLAYRLVHDVLGHVAAGGDYDWTGENKATAAHMPLLSPEAQKALFTESIGQSAYNSLYRAVGPQKISFLDGFMDEPQSSEGAGHSPVHPSQSVVPGAVPVVPTEKESSTTLDPNHGWESGIQPLEDNAFLWQREGTGKDPLDAQGLRDAASKLGTDWYHYTRPDGTPDLDTQKQAVVNSLRAVLLGQRKPFQWNAVHFQGIKDIPAGVDDPLRYFNALETQREAYNQHRGLPEGIHRESWAPERDEFYRWVKALHPELDDRGVDRLSRRELFHMLAEEEERIAADDPDQGLTSDDVASQAADAIKKRLRVITKPRLDKKFDFGSQLLHHEGAVPDPIFGNFLASHMQPIAGVSLNSDQLLKAAREDVAEHNGSGHHWRTQVTNTVPGVGPKEASLAWLLLQPYTSQLAVINPTIADALGHKPEHVNDRDYYKLERELAAGRDASGYGHIPLGQFGWGLHDYASFGHGVHRDHTPLRVIDPTPHNDIDWQNQQLPQSSWSKPYWFDSTKKAREDVGKHWDHGVATQYPKDEIPLRTSANVRYPWFIHQDTGEEIAGDPGTSLMQHIRGTLGLPTEEVWKLNLEAGKR